MASSLRSTGPGIALVAVLALVLVVAGCSAADHGKDDGDPYKASVGSNARTPHTDALGVAIVVDGEGNGRIVGALLNTTDKSQTLVGADVDTERGKARAAVIEDRVELPPGKTVELAREPAVSVSAEDFSVGFFVELTLEIKGGSPIEMLVPVEAQKGPYAEIEVTTPPDGEVAPS